MVIKCHSGFIHYNMFHNRHCHSGGNNYGSIFNITNNCGGGHMNFWGGLGLGLGMGFGNLFGGFLGNFMGGMGNMFGGFGMGNMFGGFGMGGMFGGFPSLSWGGGGGGGYNSGVRERDYSEYSSKRSSCCDDGCKCKDKDNDFSDEDNKKIKDLSDKIDNTKDPRILKKLIKELTELKNDKLTDNYEDDKFVEELGIDQLIQRAEGKIKQDSSPTKDEDTPLVAKKTVDTTPSVVTKPVPIPQPAITPPPDDINPIATTPPIDYSKLFAQDELDLLKNKDESQYGDHTNAKPEDIGNGTVKYARDIVGNKAAGAKHLKDVAPQGNIDNDDKVEISNDGKTITIYDSKLKRQDGKVTYEFVAEVDGESLYRSDSGRQLYVLQKNSSGEYVLNQYDWHKGTGKKDEASA